MYTVYVYIYGLLGWWYGYLTIIDIKVNSLWPETTKILVNIGQVMACNLIGANPLSEPIVTFSQSDPKEEQFTGILFEI